MNTSTSLSASSSPSPLRPNVDSASCAGEEMNFGSNDLSMASTLSVAQSASLDNNVGTSYVIDRQPSYSFDLENNGSYISPGPVFDGSNCMLDYNSNWTASIPDGSTETELRPQSDLHDPGQTLVIQCKWEGCQYGGSFARVADLLRHLKTVHILPGYFLCPITTCGRLFNRKDNAIAHHRRQHQFEEPHGQGAHQKGKKGEKGRRD